MKTKTKQWNEFTWNTTSTLQEQKSR